MAGELIRAGCRGSARAQEAEVRCSCFQSCGSLGTVLSPIFLCLLCHFIHEEKKRGRGRGQKGLEESIFRRYLVFFPRVCCLQGEMVAAERKRPFPSIKE